MQGLGMPDSATAGLALQPYLEPGPPSVPAADPAWLTSSVSRLDARGSPLPPLPAPPPLSGTTANQALALLRSGYTAAAVRRLCSASGMQLAVPDDERNPGVGSLPPARLHASLASVAVCGGLVLEGVLPQRTVLALAAATHAVPPGPAPLRQPFISDALLVNPWLLPVVVQALTSPRLELQGLWVQPGRPHGDPQPAPPRQQHLHAVPLMDSMSADVLQQCVQAASTPAPPSPAAVRAVMDHGTHGVWDPVTHLPPHSLTLLWATQPLRVHLQPGSHLRCAEAVREGGGCPSHAKTNTTLHVPAGAVAVLDDRAVFAVESEGPTLRASLQQEWFAQPPSQRDQVDFTGHLLGRLSAAEELGDVVAELESLYIDVTDMEAGYAYDVHGYDEASFLLPPVTGPQAFLRRMVPVVAGYTSHMDMVEQRDDT